MTSAASPSPASSQPASGASSSASSGSLSNQPPADELQHVRVEIKALTERERVLRQLLLSDPSARTGNKYAFELIEVHGTRTDWTELQAHRPDIADVISEYTFPTSHKRLEPRAITDDGELKRISRKQP